MIMNMDVWKSQRLYNVCKNVHVWTRGGRIKLHGFSMEKR